MFFKFIAITLSIMLCVLGPATSEAEAGKAVPHNLFNIGNSIGEGEAADGTIRQTHHDKVWSTGYSPGDAVNSLNERFEAADPTAYYENTAGRDVVFNHAVSGSKMNDFVDQAQAVVAAASQTPDSRVGMITILLGNNDVCADSLIEMTPSAEFENQYRAGLDVLAGSDITRNALIHVSSIPAIYWLWNAMHNNDWCRTFVWPFVPCHNLLDEPENDCVSETSRLDPDTIHPDDGPDCIRRKTFHARIRDVYNPILKGVLREYKNDGRLPNAFFVDIFDVQFEERHINDGDCFHPSIEGQAFMADIQWCRSPWGRYDPACGQVRFFLPLPLLLLED